MPDNSYGLLGLPPEIAGLLGPMRAASMMAPPPYQNGPPIQNNPLQWGLRDLIEKHSDMLRDPNRWGADDGERRRRELEQREMEPPNVNMYMMPWRPREWPI